MPEEIGYFHPDREESTDSNLDWLVRHSLLRRSTFSRCIEIYEDVARAIDEEGLSALEEGKIAEMAELEAKADKLRLISRALRGHFDSSPEDESVCLFVDFSEGDILAYAENFWYQELQQAEQVPVV